MINFSLSNNYFADINNDCIGHVLKLIEPKLQEHKQFAADQAVYEALTDLEIAEEENVKYLSEKYKRILKKKDELHDHFRKYPDYLNKLYGKCFEKNILSLIHYLAGSIIQLYVSYNKLKGNQVGKQKLEDFKNCLQNSSFNDILEYFQVEST